MLSLVRAQITPLGSSTEHQHEIKLSEGHVVHVEASDDVERTGGARAQPVVCVPLRRPAHDRVEHASVAGRVRRVPLAARARFAPTSRRPLLTATAPSTAAAAATVLTHVCQDEAVSAAVREAAARYRTGSDGLRAAAALSHAEDSQQQHQPPHEAQRDERIAVRLSARWHSRTIPTTMSHRSSTAPLRHDCRHRRPGRWSATAVARSPANRPSDPDPSPLSVRSPSGGVGRALLPAPNIGALHVVCGAARRGGSNVKRTNWSAIASFIDGASIFVSYMWSDLIASFAFSLHKIPFCGGFLDDPCTDEAPAAAQFLYALACVPVAGSSLFSESASAPCRAPRWCRR